MWTGVFVTLPNRTSLDKIAVFTFSISPIQTEILAIKEVVQWSLSHDYNVEYIFSDCINACRLQERLTTFLIRNLIIEISKLALCRISKVTCNEVENAHILAKHALVSFLCHPHIGDGV